MVYNDSKTKSKNRRKITQVGMELFIEKGIALTTVTDIVQKAEIERQTFYNYFDDKDELATYTYASTLRKLYKKGYGEEEYQNCKTGYEKIVKYFSTIVDKYIEFHEEALYLIQYDYYYQKEADAELIYKIYEEYNIVNPNLYFNEGVEDGSIKNINPDQNIFFIITQSIGAYANRVLFRNSKNFNNDKEELRRRIMIIVNVYLKALKN